MTITETIRTHKRLIPAAQALGSSATTNRGAYRYLRSQVGPQKFPPLRWARSTQTKAQYERARWSARMQRRAAAACVERGLLDREQELTRAAAISLELGLLDREKDRERRASFLAELMREHGPIPPVSGAGGCSETVRIVTPGAWGLRPFVACETTLSRGDSRVARSYDYPVRDYVVEWQIPDGATLRLVGGVVVLCVPEGADEDGIECWAAAKSRGYSARWLRGYLVQGLFVEAESLEKARRSFVRREIAPRLIGAAS